MGRLRHDHPLNTGMGGNVMAATIDELSIDYEDDGVLVVKELDREVLTRGAWTTMARPACRQA